MRQARLGRCLLPVCITVAAFLAAACHSHTYFSLAVQGEHALAAGSQPQTLDVAGLSNIKLASLPAMRSQGLDLGDVGSAKPILATLAITQPATGADLVFLQRLDAVLSADGMAPLTIAQASEFPAGQNLIQLTVVPAETIAYFKGKNVAITLVPTFAAPPPAALNLRFTFAVQARVGQPVSSLKN